MHLDYSTKQVYNRVLENAMLRIKQEEGYGEYYRKSAENKRDTRN